MSHNSNLSIGCNVTECKHHTQDDYCSLQKINVVKTSGTTNAATVESTDCASFVVK